MPSSLNHSGETSEVCAPEVCSETLWEPKLMLREILLIKSPTNCKWVYGAKRITWETCYNRSIKPTIQNFLNTLKLHKTSFSAENYIKVIFMHQKF